MPNTPDREGECWRCRAGWGLRWLPYLQLITCPSSVIIYTHIQVRRKHAHTDKHIYTHTHTDNHIKKAIKNTHWPSYQFRMKAPNYITQTSKFYLLLLFRLISCMVVIVLLWACIVCLMPIILYNNNNLLKLWSTMRSITVFYESEKHANNVDIIFQQNYHLIGPTLAIFFCKMLSN